MFPKTHVNGKPCFTELGINTSSKLPLTGMSPPGHVPACFLAMISATGGFSWKRHLNSLAAPENQKKCSAEAGRFSCDTDYREMTEMLEDCFFGKWPKLIENKGLSSHVPCAVPVPKGPLRAPAEEPGRAGTEGGMAGQTGPAHF